MTIYDIAKEAGVAASTVSRVINNKPGIKAETRERIQQLLRKYNYIPNEAARGLVMQVTKMIGILVVDIRVSHHTDGAYIIEKELTALGYCCIIFNTGPEETQKEKYLRILEQRRVDGVILIGSTFQCESIKQGIKQFLRQVPIVIANGYLDLPNVYGILIDERQGIQQCVKLLNSKERNRLAFVLDDHTPSNHLKQEGFINGMIECGWNKDHIWLYETESSLKGGYNITKQILEEHSDVEGIVFSVDLIAVGGIRALIDLGIAVPQKIAVIGVDNTIYGEICYPKLTSLNNKLNDLSVMAARVLIDALEGRQSPKKMMLFSSIIEREST